MKAFETWLLDGWMGAPWRMGWMRRNLSGRPSSCRVWPYDTSGKSGLENVAASLCRDLRSSGRRANLVGFSMGGIVIREALRQDPALPVGKIACLNSPHRGTFPARLMTRPALRELRPDSPFLKRLNSQPCPVPFLNVWCPGDLVVIPGWNARSTHATTEICSRMPAHAWPILSSRLHSQITSFFSEESPAALHSV